MLENRTSYSMESVTAWSWNWKNKNRKRKMTEFRIKEDGRTMIPSVFSHAGKKELVLLQYPQLQALDMVKHCFTTRMGGVSKNEFSSLDLSFNRGDDIEAV